MDNTLYEEALFAENFGWQPQAFVWLAPVWDVKTQTIIDFTYMYSNEVGLNYLNLKPEQLQNIRISNTPTLTNEMRVQILREMIEVYNTGITSITNIYNPIINKYGKVSRIKFRNGILTAIQDTTDETKAIQQLQEKTAELAQQKALSNSILDASINGILAMEAVRDSTGNIIDFTFIKVNQKCVDFIGLPEASIIGNSYLSLFPGSKDNGLFDVKVQIVKTGEPIQKEIYFNSLGREGWYNVSLAKLGTNGLVQTFANISESKRDKELLKTTAERLQTIVNSSQAGMFTLIPVKDDKDEVVDFRFGIVNHAVAAYIGQTAEILTGALASIYFPAYKSNGLFNIYKENYLTGTPQNFDFHYEDGYDVFFHINVVKTGDEVLVTFTDHTALKRLQRELEIKVEELKRSNANLEEFAYAASHDLQEPLRKIRYFSERLRKDLTTVLNDEATKMLERLDVATIRMKGLIDDLLTYSRASIAPSVFEPINLNVLVQNVIQDFEATISETAAIITTDNLPIVKGDERQLRQLFQNLISNALKYRKPDVIPEVSISLQKSDNKIETNLTDNSAKLYYLIEVKDNGIGFEQEYAEKIFQVFHRLHGRSEYEGTGVGLAIAQKVIHNHNGLIKAQSEPGQGATFSILLPQ